MLRVTKITFPGLFPNLELEVDSVAFTLFGHSFPWYALIITTGIILCFIYVTYRAKRIGIIPDHIIDIGLVTVSVGIIGARLYYVLTSLDHYDSFWDVFKIWEGGLGIYGGLIGGGLGVFLMCKIKKFRFMPLADCIGPSLLLAQSLGRWGNFFNAEAYGSETEIFCRMGLNFGYGETIYVHPTFFYESLWNILGFIIADFLYRKKRLYDGFIIQFVFAWYGFGRMFIEVLRSDSLYICSYHAWFTKISVLVGFAFFVGCTAWIIYNIVSIKKGKQLPLTPIVEAKAEVASEGEEQ